MCHCDKCFNFSLTSPYYSRQKCHTSVAKRPHRGHGGQSRYYTWISTQIWKIDC